MHRVANLEAAFDPQPFQRGKILERSAAGALVDVARIANAVLLRELVKERLGLVKDDARAPAGLMLRDASLFEQCDVDTGGREHVCRRAAHGATTNDGDVGMQVASMPRIRRTPGGGETIQPEAGPVMCLGQCEVILLSAGAKGQREGAGPAELRPPADPLFLLSQQRLLARDSPSVSAH